MSYRTAQLVNLWGVSARRVRALLGELEALGFALEADEYGARRVPGPLAEAVKITRQAGLALSTLRERDELQVYLPRDERAEPVDELAVLIRASAELSILREAVGGLSQALEHARTTGANVHAVDWSWLGLPDARRGL
jgi:hypothetical protein